MPATTDHVATVSFAFEVELHAQQDVERSVIAREVLDEQDLRVGVALPADEVATGGVANDAVLADDAARRIERIAGSPPPSSRR